MKKKYIAKSDLSVNVVLDSGNSLHISFSPITGGTSVFYTEDERIQKALEQHYKYGKLFKGEEVVTAQKTEAEVEAEEEEEGLTVINISDVDAAKDYLSEKYGISRTKLKTLSAINKAAAANGIEFNWEE
jgi:hypothetical protein